MMGQRVMAESLFYSFRIEDHVPDDHALRAVDGLLDTAFVREIMAPHYSTMGRPSIDPELMVRMLLIGYAIAVLPRQLADFFNGIQDICISLRSLIGLAFPMQKSDAE